MKEVDSRMKICEKKIAFMLIYVRISEALKAKADQLVAAGDYSDFSALVDIVVDTNRDPLFAPFLD